MPHSSQSPPFVVAPGQGNDLWSLNHLTTVNDCALPLQGREPMAARHAAGERPVVVITGANRGIGLEAARTLLAAGCRVAALDTTTDALHELEPAADLLVCHCDVRNSGDVHDAVSAITGRWGRIDVLVNNAAVAPFGRLEEMPMEAIRNVFDVNVFGYVRTIAAVLPVMKAQGRGTIVNVASMLASVGLPSLPAYAASKGAVDGLTRSLALDLRRYGITVKLFHPPSTRTPAARPLCLPRFLTGDPVKVGATLAGAAWSRRPVVVADARTAALLLLTRLVPVTFGRALTGLVLVCQTAAQKMRVSPAAPVNVRVHG